MSRFTDGLRFYLRLISLRKALFFSAALLGMSVAVVISYMLPKNYEAKTTIFIEQNVITDLVKGIAVSPSMQMKIKNLSVTLTSRNLLLRLIKALDKDLSFRDESEQEKYIKDLQQRVKVVLNERQGLLTIGFLDRNPVFARDFVNTMARIYIEQNTSTKREESMDATNFLGEQIQTFKKRVDIADEAINRFKSEKGLILSVDETYLRGEIGTAEKKLEELTLRRVNLERKREILMPGKTGRRQSASNPEAELKRLLSIYTEKHPKVIRARAALQSGRGGGESSESNGALGADQTAKLVQLEIDAIKTMEDHQGKIIEDSKALLRDMPQVKSALAELQRKKEQEANIYNQLVARYGQSEISKQMELNDKSTTFRIVDPAVIPEVPASPNRPAIILVGIFLSLGFGVACVYLADHFNRSIRSIRELKTIGVPVVAIIPLIVNEQDVLIQARKDRLVMVMAGGGFAGILGVLTYEVIKLMGLAGVFRGMARHIF